MPEFTQALEALRLQDWYAAAALILTIAVQVFRKAPWLGDRLWQRIPDGLRWAVPILGGAVIAFTGAFAEGASLLDALKAALGGAGAIGFGSMGFAATLRESPIPWDGGKGGRPTAVLLLALCLPATTACDLFGSKVPDEAPPCDDVSYAKLSVECGDNEAECDEAISEREAFCAKRIQGEP